MNRNFQPRKSNSPSDIWHDFVQSELKNKSKIGTLIEFSIYGGYENKCLTIYFSDDNLRKNAQGQLKAIQTKLKDQFGLLCDRIDFNTGSASVTSVSPKAIKVITSIANTSKLGNSLQALYWTEPKLPDDKDEVQRMQILKSTVAAEQSCNEIYQKLRDRTLKLVDNQEEDTLNVAFNWRLRVGGTRGFRELLLPVLHPVFGIPYIPASTLKGAANWLQPHADSMMSLKWNLVDLSRTLEQLEDALDRSNQQQSVKQHLQEARTKEQQCLDLLSDRLNELELYAQRTANLSDRLYREVITSNMRPFADGIQSFPRMIRDLARKLDKLLRS
jgi:hypothetical protein